MRLNLPGNDLENIFPAMEFLTASNKKGLGDKVELFDNGILNAEGKDIVVIGGGDTAMDCVRTSIRQKAKSVKCLYRRDKENMPGSAREVANAEEEGVEFVWLSSPKEFKGTNKVEKLVVNKIKLVSLMKVEEENQKFKKIQVLRLKQIWLLRLWGLILKIYQLF